LIFVVHTREACIWAPVHGVGKGNDRYVASLGGSVWRWIANDREQLQHTCTVDVRVQCVQASMLHDSHRCVQNAIQVSQATLHAETGGPYLRETELDARNGVRQAERTSDGEAVEGDRHSTLRFSDT